MANDRQVKTLKGFVLRWLAMCLVLTFACPSCQLLAEQNYVVKHICFANRDDVVAGVGQVKLMAYETGSGEYYRVNEPFRDKIYSYWCDEWDFLPHNLYRKDTLPVNLMASRQVYDLVRASGGNTQTDTYGNTACCHPGLGLKGLNCSASVPGAYQDRYWRSLCRFHCIYDENADELIFVDGETIDDAQPAEPAWRARNNPFFDHEGKYLYYIMDGRAKRFCVSTKQIDTIPGGDMPVIPWNRRAVIVYSQENKQFRLLDESLRVRATIDWDLEGRVLTAYAIDDSTFLLGVSWAYSAPGSGGVSSTTLMAVLEMDFQRRGMREIIEGLSPGQIFSAERVE